MPITTMIDKVRLEIGDTDPASFLLSDDELNYFITQAGGSDIYLSAALACEALATRFARAYNFETDGQKFERRSMSRTYADRAKDLRAKAGAGAGATITTTRIDGYSQDITNEDVLETDINVRSRYYGQRDEIPS